MNGATRINSDSSLLTLSGGFSGAQNLTIGGAGGTTLSGDLAIGAGTLTKDAAGVLTLSAASTRSGGTAFSGATLVVGAQGALGSGSVTGTSSSVLAFNTATNATFSNAMTLASAEQNSIRNNSTNSTVTLNGNIAGSGPSFFTFVGTGASNAGFVLGGSNTFTGTRVVVKDTSLTIANNSAVNAPSFPRVSLGDAGGSGAAVYLLDGINLNVKVVDANNTAITGPMAFTVGMKTAGTSTISGTSTANVAMDLHAMSTGGTSNAWALEAVSGATLNITGAIVNTGTNAQSPLTKTGLGTVVFSRTNTYGGTTTVSAGTLGFAGGSQASPITVASGAFVQFALGSPISSSQSVTLVSGAKVKITGTPVAPNSYTLMTATGGFSGTPVLDSAISGYSLVLESGNTVLKLNYTGTAGFSSWITGSFANGTVPAGKQGPNDDPTSDGINTLMKYAIAGQDPTVANPTISTFSGNTVSFTKRLPLAADLTYSIELSTDLGVANAWAEAPAGASYVNNSTAISYTFTPGTPVRNFARLKVTAAP